MTGPQLESYRQQLQDLASRIKGDVTLLADEALRNSGGEASGGLSNVPLHPADLGTDAFNQELTMSLLESEEHALAEIAAALTRLDQHTFGACERCQRAIARERLQALPFARYCIDCARLVEEGNADAV